jgi:hypothetical protein
MTAVEQPSAAAATAMVDRRGACVIVAPGRTGVASLPSALTGSLLAWARDPDLYAIVIDARGLDPATAIPDLHWRAVADMLWRLDCFSKPIVTLLGAVAGPLAVAMALVGTHRALTPAGELQLGADQALIPLPPLMRATSAAFHRFTDTVTGGVIEALADAEPVDPLLDGLSPALPIGMTAVSGMTPQARDALEAAAQVDLRAATLALDARRGDPTPWTLPTRADLQSLRIR